MNDFKPPRVIKTKLKLLQDTKKFRKTPRGVLTNMYCHQKSRRIVKYTLEELHNKFLNDRKFIRLMEEWKKNRYDKKYKPTIDRIDCKKPYTLTNIQCLTWTENRYKQRMELKRIRAKKVYQITGNKIVDVHSSVTRAVKKTGLCQSGISMCLNGKRKYCGGYRWSYENPDLLKDKTQ